MKRKKNSEFSDFALVLVTVIDSPGFKVPLKKQVHLLYMLIGYILSTENFGFQAKKFLLHKSQEFSSAGASHSDTKNSQSSKQTQVPEEGKRQGLQI